MLVVSVAYYQMATSVPVSRLADAIGPQGLPKVYGLMLAALSLVVVVNARRAPSESRSAKTRSGALRAIGMITIGVAYIVLAPWIGYLLAISALILATTYYQGGTIGRHAALVALGGGVFFWVLFVVLMGIHQPPGFFPPQW
jgi:hypothetical protein